MEQAFSSQHTKDKSWNKTKVDISVMVGYRLGNGSVSFVFFV